LWPETSRKILSLEQAAENCQHAEVGIFAAILSEKPKRFMEFFNETRLTHAQKLLVESDKNILKSLYECGYESASYFYRLFIKRQSYVTCRLPETIQYLVEI
jgi:AraC-like DNA-binding protein